MFEFQVEYSFKDAETRDRFLALLKENDIEGMCAKEAGCRRYEYFLPTDGRPAILLLELWERLEDQQAHIQEAAIARLKEIRTGFEITTELKKFKIEEA